MLVGGVGCWCRFTGVGCWCGLVLVVGEYRWCMLLIRVVHVGLFVLVVNPDWWNSTCSDLQSMGVPKELRHYHGFSPGITQGHPFTLSITPGFTLGITLVSYYSPIE